MKGGTLLAIAGLLLWIAQPGARAGVISSQGPPNGNNFDITDSRLADDFSLTAAATLNEIGFWYQAQEQTDLAVITYAVYQDSSGALGALLQSETVDNPGTSFDAISGLFFADFNITPLDLLGGTTYWLELHAGSSLTDASGFTVSWGAADDNATNVALENATLGLPNSPVGFSGFNQYAFVLSGASSSSIPEPVPAALLLFGLFLLPPMARRARRPIFTSSQERKNQ